MIRRLWSRLISAIAPTWPGDYSRLDLMDGLGSLDEAPAITEEIPIVTTHDPRWSQAGLASVRRFTTSGEDGGWRCAYGTWHGIHDSCTCAPANVLAAAGPPTSSLLDEIEAYFGRTAA